MLRIFCSISWQDLKTPKLLKALQSRFDFLQPLTFHALSGGVKKKLTKPPSQGQPPPKRGQLFTDPMSTHQTFTQSILTHTCAVRAHFSFTILQLKKAQEPLRVVGCEMMLPYEQKGARKEVYEDM